MRDKYILRHFSLNLTHNISVESILWVLYSMKIDKLTPTERQVQNRIKEVFGIKI